MMNPHLLFLCLFACVACAPLRAADNHESTTTPLPITYALESVNLIPIVPEGVLRNQTLLVKGERIVAMGDAAEIEIPPDAIRLDVKNKFVMPGLSDMHVHLDGEGDLLLMLRHGVTRVRNLSENTQIAKLVGAPVMPELKKKVAARKAAGPELFNCGPILDGSTGQSSGTVHR